MSFIAILDFAKRFWPAALIGVCVVALLLAALRIQWVESERDALQSTVTAQTAELATLKADATAKEQASVERAADTEKDAATQKETADALRSAPDPRLALSCLRLKRAGAATPAACR